MDLQSAHRHSMKNRTELESSNACGCVHCLGLFAPDEVRKWTDEGQTALCPKCGIDSVLGSACGFELNDSFLREMRRVGLEEQAVG